MTAPAVSPTVDARIVKLAGEANRADLVFRASTVHFVCNCVDGLHDGGRRHLISEGEGRLAASVVPGWHLVAVDRLVADTTPRVVATGGAR